ncbi:MAG: hypothetical protein ABIP75_03570 [Pyrinomonadaceae bacterium]
MKTRFIYLFAAIAVSFATVNVGSAQTSNEMTAQPPMTMTKDMSNCPMMKQDGEVASRHDHDAMVMANGEKAMGFSQTATTHHFLLLADGGAIQVEANDPNDILDRDRIRTHLTEIAGQFTEGIFTTPFAIHGRVPEGVPVMDQLKAKIKYRYEQTPNGARVRISTTDQIALAAIHDFIRFQINEHNTGDPLSLK